MRRLAAAQSSHTQSKNGRVGGGQAEHALSLICVFFQGPGCAHGARCRGARQRATRTGDSAARSAAGALCCCTLPQRTGRCSHPRRPCYDTNGDYERSETRAVPLAMHLQLAGGVCVKLVVSEVPMQVRQIVRDQFDRPLIAEDTKTSALKMDVDDTSSGQAAVPDRAPRQQCTAAAPAQAQHRIHPARTTRAPTGAPCN